MREKSNEIRAIPELLNILKLAGCIVTIDAIGCQKNIVASIIEKEGYLAALDCDILFSCVDRPWARKILNHIAFAHLIPVIDGGIAVRMKESFSGVDWQLQTATLGNVCLKCAGCYNDTEVDLDKQGLLDDPTYMRQQNSINQTLAKRNENIFPFSANLASLEVIQMIALVTGSEDFGIQRYRFHPVFSRAILKHNYHPATA